MNTRTRDLLRFRAANACHWVIELGPPLASLRDRIVAALARVPRTQHHLVAQGIAEVTGGDHTFADVAALWSRGSTDCAYMRWNDADGCLQFLLLARDVIDPFSWPAARPRFRLDPTSKPPAKRKRCRREPRVAKHGGSG